MITGTKDTLVRFGFGEIDIWAHHVGNVIALRATVVDGPIDAPERILAGGMASTTIGPVKQVTYRGID